MKKRKEITIRQRAEEIVETFKVPDEKKGKALVAIMELIERAKSPEMFCAKCDTRMSIDLESSVLDCFSCGHKTKLNLENKAPIARPAPAPVDSPASKVKTDAQPNEAPPNSKLLKAIDKAEKGEPTKKGKSILELAGSRGVSPVTKEDNEHLKSSVPGAKNSDINWCQ